MVIFKTCSKKQTYVLCTKSEKIKSSHPEEFRKKGVLRNFVNSQRNTCARVSFLMELQAWYFPVNFAKSPRTTFLTEHLRWLLLKNECPAGKESAEWNLSKCLKLLKWPKAQVPRWLSFEVSQVPSAQLSQVTTCPSDLGNFRSPNA